MALNHGMITTIIFDIGEVCLQGVFGVEHTLAPILKAPPKEIYEKTQGEELIALLKGEISEEEFIKKIIKKNKWKISTELFKKLIRENFREIRGVRPIIEELKNKGYKLGLLSIHAKEWVDYCDKKFDYHKLFHSKLYSFEVALLKPDKRVYQLILKKLNKPPEECLFIDDHPKNIIAANELGINTIQFKDAEQLKADLKKFRIKIS